MSLLVNEDSALPMNIKEEPIELEENSTPSQIQADTVLSMIKPELETLETKADCVITNLLVSDSTGVVKYEISPDSNLLDSDSQNLNLEQTKLENHVETHKFQCSVCNFFTSTKRGLQLHKTMSHQKILLKCTFCDKMVNRYRLKSHMNRAHDRERNKKCRHCDFIGSWNELLSHIQNNHKVEKRDRRYGCPKCKKRFQGFKALKNHEIRCNQKLDSVTNICQTCKKTFKTKTMLLVHRRVHTGVRPFPCHLCNYSATLKGNLTKHISSMHSTSADKDQTKIHSVESSFAVDFSSDSQIKTFQNSHENLSSSSPTKETSSIILLGPESKGQSSLDCKKCDISCKTEIEYDLHLISVEHRNNGRRVADPSVPKSLPVAKICPQCGKEFKNKRNLSQHMMMHTGERPFSCQLCDYSAARKSTLTNHMTKKHPTSDERTTCRGCNEEFFSLKVLKKHINYCVHL